METFRIIIVFMVLICVFTGCVVPRAEKVPPPIPPPVDVEPGLEIDAARFYIQRGIKYFRQSKTTLDENEEKLLSEDADRNFKKALVCFYKALESRPTKEHFLIYTEIRELLKIFEYFSDRKYLDRDMVRQFLAILDESTDGLTPEERAQKAELERLVVPPDDLGVTPVE